MSAYLSRLATFFNCNFLHEYRVSSSTFARTGYIYNHSEKQVQCSSCHFAVHKRWEEEEQIIPKHKKFNRNCRYTDDANITQLADLFQPKNSSVFLKKWQNSNMLHSNESGEEVIQPLGIPATEENVFANRGDSVWSLLTPRFKDTTEDIRNRNLFEGDCENNSSNIGRLDVDVGHRSPVGRERNRSSITSLEIQLQAKHLGLANREERVRTFRGQDHKYSRSNYTDIITQLVDAGLYYVGPIDNVRCFFCDGELKNFSANNKPFDEHQKFFSDCKYVKYLQDKYKNKSDKDKDKVENERNPSRITQLEIQQQAKHPGLANREERVRTFRGQDHRYSTSNYPDIIKQLVDAGLYYVGPTDNVRCFFCDGGLKNFSPDDKPFEEHQKWFSDCKYVKYLQDVKNKRDKTPKNHPSTDVVVSKNVDCSTFKLNPGKTDSIPNIQETLNHLIHEARIVTCDTPDNVRYEIENLNNSEDVDLLIENDENRLGIRRRNNELAQAMIPLSDIVDIRDNTYF